jgi:hypothetical protein
MADTDIVADAGEGRRPSIEKKPIMISDADEGLDGLDDTDPPAFERLPDEIIQQYAPSLCLYVSIYISLIVAVRAQSVLSARPCTHPP